MKIEKFKKAVNVSATNELITSIIEKYTKAERNDISLSSIDINSQIYSVINKSEKTSSFNEQDKQAFTKMIFEDIKKSGFQPTKMPKGIQPGWITYQSWNLVGGEKIQEKDFKHRFYLAMPADQISKFCSALYSKYRGKNVPFYFKINRFAETKPSKDNIVIYTSNQYIDETLAVLNECAKEIPECLEKCEKPAPIVGNINDWLGYSSDPEEKGDSYTGLISNCFEEGLYSAITEIQKHTKILENGKSVTIEDIDNMLISPERNIMRQRYIRTLMSNPACSSIICDSIRNAMENHGLQSNNLTINNKTFKELEQLQASNQMGA